MSLLSPEQGLVVDENKKVTVVFNNTADAFAENLHAVISVEANQGPFIQTGLHV